MEEKLEDIFEAIEGDATMIPWLDLVRDDILADERIK
jgi:hypothetical protein